MTTLLLTGASGLVGSRLLPRLVRDGLRLPRAPPPRPRRCRRARPAYAATSATRARSAQAVEGVDAVVHLAALFRTADEDAIWRANLDGTRNLVEAVKAYAPRPASSWPARATSTTRTLRARPRDRRVPPTAAYPASKLAAEALLRDSGLTWSIVRLPSSTATATGTSPRCPSLASRFGLHPAHTYSVLHQRDVAVVMRLALSGAWTAEWST